MPQPRGDHHRVEPEHQYLATHGPDLRRPGAHLLSRRHSVTHGPHDPLSELSALLQATGKSLQVSAQTCERCRPRVLAHLRNGHGLPAAALRDSHQAPDHLVRRILAALTHRDQLRLLHTKQMVTAAHRPRRTTPAGRRFVQRLRCLRHTLLHVLNALTRDVVELQRSHDLPYVARYLSRNLGDLSRSLTRACQDHPEVVHRSVHRTPAVLDLDRELPHPPRNLGVGQRRGRRRVVCQSHQLIALVLHPLAKPHDLGMEAVQPRPALRDAGRLDRRVQSHHAQMPRYLVQITPDLRELP